MASTDGARCYSSGVLGRPLALALTMILTACAAKARLAPVGPFPMATLWTTSLEESIEGELAADERRVFVATRDGAILALDGDTGALLWKVTGPTRRVVSARPGVLVARGLDGALSSLSPRNGAARWTVATAVKGDLPALVADDVFVVAGEGLSAVEAATGRVLWSLPPDAVATAPPVLVGTCLLVGEGDGTLRCRDPKTGASRWTYGTGSALLAPPVADAEGHIVVGTTDRRILSLDLGKGHLRWRFKVGADVQNAAAVQGKRVFVAAFDAVLYAVFAGNGNLAWRVPLPSRPLSPPLLTHGALILACHENEIVGFDPRTGRRVGGLKTSELLRTSPLVSGRRLFVGLRNRSVQAFDLPATGGAPELEPDSKDRASEAP